MSLVLWALHKARMQGGKRSCQKMNNYQNTFLVPLGPLGLLNGKY